MGRKTVQTVPRGPNNNVVNRTFLYRLPLSGRRWSDQEIMYVIEILGEPMIKYDFAIATKKDSELR